MRVLALLPDAYDEAGGIAQYNRDWLDALEADRNIGEIRLCCLSAQNLSQPRQGAGKISTIKTMKSKWRFAMAAIVEIHKYSPDIVFCGHQGLLKLLPWLPRKNKWRLWLQLHGIEAWPIAGKKIRRIAMKASLVTCVSRYTRAKALAWVNIEPERIKVLPNTVNENFFFRDEDAKHEVDGRKILLTVGRLSSAEKYKGQDKVIEAMPEILQAYPDAVYWVAGAGDDEPRLRALAAAKGVAAQVRFLGYVGKEELPNLFRRADLYVMPSTGEGFGIAFLEAMASGIPALGLNMDGSIDPLADGELGVCLAQGDSLADAITNVLAKKVNGLALSQAVNARFGRAAFNHQVSRLVASAFLMQKGDGNA